MRYPFVTFDAGETLLAPREPFGVTYARVLRDLGVSREGADLARGVREAWAAMSSALPQGIDRYSRFLDGERGFWTRFVSMALGYAGVDGGAGSVAERAVDPLRDWFRDPGAWSVYPDVPPALRALRALGARLAVVSNWDSRLPALLERLGIAGEFDAIVVSHLEGIEKPDPALFVAALSRIGGKAAGAIHVGDTPELDGAGAAAAGIRFVLVDRDGRTRRATGALRDLSGLPALAAGA